MALAFQPKDGSIVMCDFKGLVEPEMVKTRPVVILRKHRHNSKLVVVVPLSTTAPTELKDYHIELPSSLGDTGCCWAKCDMVYTLSIERLDRIKQKDRQGNRRYVTLYTTAEQLTLVRNAVTTALGL